MQFNVRVLFNSDAFFRVFTLLTMLFAMMLTTSIARATETIPPLTTPSPIMGTYGTTRNVTLTCSDSGGSGCATTYYCLGSGCTPATPYSGPVSIASTTSLSFYSTDLDGNKEQARTYVYTIDPTQTYRFSRLWPQLAQPWYFNVPSGVAIDQDSNIYVADTGNNRIQKFDSSGTFIIAWGTYGNANGEFSYPSGISVDSAGSVYVADTGNNRVQRFTANGEFVTAWGSNGSDTGQLYEPLGIAADPSGNIYVTDTGNNRIQKFDSSGNFVTAWGMYGNSNGQLNTPSAIAVDAAGSVYVVDTGNSRIQKFDAAGTFELAWGSEGSGNGQFIQPSSIFVNGDGDVHIADTFNHRIQKFTSSGAFVNAWGSEGGDSGKFSYPRGVTTDSAGNIYVADTSNSRIQKINPTGVPLATWSSNGSVGGQFKNPVGIAVLNMSGTVYVADTENHRIQQFTSTGSFVRAWGVQGSGNGQFNYPQGIALDSSALVYVADTGNHRIQKFNSWGAIIAVWGAMGDGDGQFSAPSGIALDSAGNMYVLDTGNNRVQKLSSGGAFISSWGSSGSDNGQFDSPFGIAVDGSGNVYIADTDNNRIQKFDSYGNFITSWGSYGTGDGQFDSPRGITVDSSQNVYITDSNNSRIQMFTGNGTFVTGWGKRDSGNGQFNNPQGIAVDSASGNVYIADSSNNRIQKFLPPLLPGIPTGVTATAGYGQATISFSPPAANGSSPVLFYKVTSTPGNITATGSSPITVTGLSGGTEYTFTVAAINNGGTGPASAPSNSIIPESGYSLTATVNGSGTIHSLQNPDINCAGSCVQTYPDGAIVTLTAVPDSGYTFIDWSGDCSGSGNCSITMNQAQTVEALFVFTGTNGVCGSAHSGNYSTAPTTNHCAVGALSPVTGIGPWTWTCDGSGGGTTAYCSAAEAGGIVHRSSDSGSNWIPGKTGLDFNNPTNVLLVSPTYSSDRTVFIGANSGIYRSTDSGDNLNQLGAGAIYMVYALAASPAYATDHTLFAGSYQNGFHKSIDSGNSWWQSNTGLDTTMIFSLAVSPAYASDRTIFAGIYSKGVYKSTDSGATWSAANAGIDTISPLSLAISPNFAADQTVYAATTDGQYGGGGPYYHVYKSVNGGSSWSLADTGLSGSINSLAISPAFSSDQTLFAATSNGIYKTTDSGVTWTRVSTASSGGSNVVLSPAYVTDQTVVASVYGDNVYRSSNGGNNWTDSNSSFTVGNKQLVALALSPSFASDHAVFAATYLNGPYSVVSPGSLSFGNIKANSTSNSRQVTITNGNGMFGDANLAITGMTLSGASAAEFSISAGNCDSLTPTLPVGASCSVDITLTPAFAGSKSATLQIAHNEISRPTWAITLSGTGVTVSSTVSTPVINGNSVSLSGTASCSAGDSVAGVEISFNNGATWQPASGTTSWSISLTLPDGSYPILSRATTSSGIVETPGFGGVVTTPGIIDTDAPTGTLALYNGVWTLNANARDGDICLMVYPNICGTVEMSPNGVSGWQPATTTPGTGGPLWLRDQAGNVSARIDGAYSNINGGPIRLEGGSATYYSYLQHALNAAGSGALLKINSALYSENLTVNTFSTGLTVRGGYNSGHSSVTGTTQLSGSLTVQNGTLTVENLDVAGTVTLNGGTVTASALSIQ